jgi:hypothetical protein
MHENQPDTETVQQCYVVHQVGKMFVCNRFSTKCEHKGATTVGMNIRRRVPEAVYKMLVSVFL